MWQVVASIISAIMGLGAGLIGGANNAPPAAPNNTQTVGYQTQACYNPELNVRLTLKWPDDFTSVPDNRLELNPDEFTYDNFDPFYKARVTPLPDGKANFDSDPACYSMWMKNARGTPMPGNERTYIRIRQNVRIASCKTDELAGPYNGSGFNCGSTQMNPFAADTLVAAQRSRGSCEVTAYPDLRKIAQLKKGQENLEIFWAPFSHNVGCNYDPDRPNCGIGDRTNINLREFIYVLDKRDAFAPGDSPNCKVLWDAGSTNKGACSHYFDVYIAEDLWNKIQSPVPTTDPDWDNYNMYRQAIANCQEQNTFIPVLDTPGYTFPPSFIDRPIVISNYSTQQEGKIIPENDFEKTNNQAFLLFTPVINPVTTSLVQTHKSAATTITACTQSAGPTPTVNPHLPPGPGAACFVPLGSIFFRKQNSETVKYRVYSKYQTPQTFYLLEATGSDKTVYQYTITDEKIQTTNQRAPALQLNTLQISTENLWTWATPVCKPAIYLYPPKPMDINVKLELDGTLTKSDPVYDQNQGWSVRALPNGSLSPLTTHNSQLTTNHYPYLYYEADIKGLNIPKEGWVVEKSNLKSSRLSGIPPAAGQITLIMKTLGFNDKETGDFLAYWLPRLTDKPYYFITLLPEDQINQKEQLEFSTVNPQLSTINSSRLSGIPPVAGQLSTLTPDTLIRVRMIFEGLDTPLRVRPLKIPETKVRNGFTVTDWGGTLIGKSCEDVKVR